MTFELKDLLSQYCFVPGDSQGYPIAKNSDKYESCIPTYPTPTVPAITDLNQCLKESYMGKACKANTKNGVKDGKINGTSIKSGYASVVKTPEAANVIAGFMNSLYKCDAVSDRTRSRGKGIIISTKCLIIPSSLSCMSEFETRSLADDAKLCVVRPKEQPKLSQPVNQKI